MSLSKKPQLVLGPPLNNGPWAAVYDPSWERGHRRVIYTVNGKARIPGRFAIDFIKLDGQGRYANGDNNVIKNWYGYGNDVLAVADGVVASIRNDFSESPTLSGPPEYTADKATGNYISIDIGNNHFAFYEHLKPGSIKIKPGQRVKKGDIIASVGFTGQTTGPHLHFHVANVNSPLGAEGIPFVFDRFTLLGSYPNFENFGNVPWVPVKNSNQLMTVKEHPASNSVIKFK
jgi:murein DD-endopeptidase MepM/ murein hydrolase activator NlpD